MATGDLRECRCKGLRRLGRNDCSKVLRPDGVTEFPNIAYDDRGTAGGGSLQYPALACEIPAIGESDHVRAREYVGDFIVRDVARDPYHALLDT
jgi:hypothetical protein